MQYAKIKARQERKMEMYKEIFNQRLKKARQETGFTQREVARETKIPHSTIANYETARTEPNIENLGILADFYGVSVDWLLGTKGEQIINHAKIEKEYYKENK